MEMEEAGVYGVSHLRPKHHYSMHLPEMVSYYGPPSKIIK